MGQHRSRACASIQGRSRVNLAINCLSISTASALGVRTFLITHLQQFGFFSHELIQDFHLTIFVQKDSALKPEILTILKECGPRLHPRIVEVKLFAGSAQRIIYEQAILPFLLRKCQAIWSINNVNPIFLFGGIKSIVTIHDLLPFKVGSRFKIAQRAYIKLFTRICVWRSAAVVTVSNFTKGEILQLLDVSENKILVVYNCLPQPFEKTHSPSQKSILCLGGLNKDKRIDLTIIGFAEFIRHDPESRLQLVIAGPNQGAQPQLEDLTASLEIASDVIFLGQVSEEQKSQLLRNCSGLVMMGRNEGFGIPVLEAMRLGKPSLVADAGALPEVTGRAGIVVQSPESAEQLADGISSILEPGHNWTSICREEYSRFQASRESRALWIHLLHFLENERLNPVQA
jgi:glycosyltransferase involved in cell wall biosynthesis